MPLVCSIAIREAYQQNEVKEIMTYLLVGYTQSNASYQQRQKTNLLNLQIPEKLLIQETVLFMATILFLTILFGLLSFLNCPL